MNETKDWSRKWEGSSDPSKQRKFRENAPHHHRKRFLNSQLADSPREKLGTRSVPLRTGDRVEVMRGDFAGETGRVDDIDTDEQKVYVDGVETESVDESDTPVPLRSSNLKITKLELEDPERLAKYEVTEEEKEEISVETEEEPEEDIEEEKMETGEGSLEEAADGEEEDFDYQELVQENIGDVKEAVEREGLDPEKVLEAERKNKDRVTLTKWLENRIEGDTDE